ncbi:ankyrin repeat domain-containing protein [bacterium]|nr:ankyrin repeat domain-containing protein [bacterium]
MEAGAELNKAVDSGQTPLYMAAGRGHEAVVRVLIEAGANASYLLAAEHAAIVKSRVDASAV